MHSSFSAKVFRTLTYHDHVLEEPQSTNARVAALEAEMNELQAQLGPDEDAQQIVSRHIKLLHEYNEAKDATQVRVTEAIGGHAYTHRP
jgi:hypothetical protein